MFNKKIEKNCAYCTHGYMLSNGTECLCDKYGIVSSVTNCRKFKYEPLKRVPSRTPNLPEYEAADFNL